MNRKKAQESINPDVPHAETAAGHANPLLAPYGTPHDTVPFDRLRPSDIEEALLEGIRRDDEATAKIVDDTAEPTFDNTLARVDTSHGEHYYDLLERTSNVFSCLLSAETNDDLDALAQKMSPILTKHANDISLNKGLFGKIKYVHEHHRPLTAEEQMLLQTAYDGFVRSGALLDDDGKARLRALTERAGTLALTFSQNLLKAGKAFQLHITDEGQLDGLPETAREAAAQAAREQGKEGWLFTLDQPSYGPFMTYSTQRALRRQMYMARNTECAQGGDLDNRDICRQLVNIRREVAQLLGFDTYADYVLQHRMAGTTANVYRLLGDLIRAYKPTALKEVAEVAGEARLPEAEGATDGEGTDTEVEPWDFSFYSHKLQVARFDLDQEMLRPYFELGQVIKGVFGLATRLYGITFKENGDIPVWHPDVKAYEVFDGDGSYLAVLYADFHPRKGKQDGAWMTELQGQWIDHKGHNVRPHVVLVMNLTKPTPDKPALLTLGEVETFLHEFGHALHGMFANTRFESLSGTNVWWDFVELPSQFMENYAVEKDFLRTFAFHYQTGEPIPDELVDRIVSSRNFMAAYSCMRQVSFGLLDMAYYTQTKPFTADIIPFEKEAWKDAVVTRQLPDTCMTTQFSHIMAGGYAAGYYSYKWAEVLEADAFSVFKKNGIFDRKTAQRFRDCILSKGGTEHPMTLYKRFRGQEPTIDALLERDGIKKAEDGE